MTEYELRILVIDLFNNHPVLRKLRVSNELMQSITDTAVKFAIKDELIELGPDKD